jgi:hypothetical protein
MPLGSAQSLSGAQAAASPIQFDKNPAVYSEGSSVFITIPNPAGSDVAVFCQSGCSAQATQVYDAPLASNLVFPAANFCQLLNGLRDCSDAPNALELYEPRWNGTWVVQERGPGGAAIAQATFQVTFTTAYRFNYVLEPTNFIVAQAGGFVPGTSVFLEFGRRNADGTTTSLIRFQESASPQGTVLGAWYVPKTEAELLTCTGTTCDTRLNPCAYCHPYFATVTANAAQGNSKTSETVWYFVRPADLNPWITVQPLGSYQRTMMAQLRFSIHYPDGELPVPPDFPHRGTPGNLRVQVQRTDPQTGIMTPINNLSPTEGSVGVDYLANWTIPRNLQLTTPEGKAFEFQLVVMPGHDAYGNNILQNASNPFFVDPAALNATYLAPIANASRAENVAWTILAKYYDNETFDTKVNGTWLQGHLSTLNDQGVATPVPAATVHAVPGANGTWVFRYHFAVDYAPLARHVFTFDGGPVLANDTFGNYIATNNSPSFLVQPAAFTLQLTEKSGQDLLNATSGYVRGQSISFAAHIAYPDGTPFNTTVKAGPPQLNVTLIKRLGSSFVEEDILPFHATDLLGDWVGGLSISLTNRDAPLGKWELDFPLFDRQSPANGNTIGLNRTIRPATLHLEPYPFAHPEYLLGSTIYWNFRLVYPDGSVATPDEVSGTQVAVYRWSGVKLLSLTDPSVAAVVGQDGTWTASWTPPNGTELGAFVFVPTASDRWGNPLAAAHSLPFIVYAQTETRDALQEPRSTVVRNESVSASFVNYAGDTAVNGTGNPRIELERWSDLLQNWTIELENVYAGNGGPGTEHIGIWHTTLQSPLGRYRFVLDGMNAQHIYITGNSTPFTLLPLNDTRPIVEAPPPLVPKGTVARFTILAAQNDIFQAAWIDFNGTHYKSLQIQGHGRNWTFVFQPTFDADAGNYTFEVQAIDMFGNGLDTLGDPFSVAPATLHESLLGAPDPLAARGTDVTLSFRAFYPDGSIVTPLAGAARATFTGPGDATFLANATYLAPNWYVKATVPFTTPLGFYNISIGGAATHGNAYAPWLAANVTITPGTITRPFSQNPVSLGREKVFIVKAAADLTSDKALSCYVGYLGSTQYAPQDQARFPVAFAPVQGQYVIHWATNRTTDLGWYRFECDGRDQYDNNIVYTSTSAQLLPEVIFSQAGPAPPLSAFGGGKTYTLHVQYYYADSTIETPDLGTPDAQVTYNGQVVSQAPTITYDASHRWWQVTWTAPQVLPAGIYIIGTQGQDVNGNTFYITELAHYDFTPSLADRVFGIPGFSAAVPGPDPLLVVGLIAGAAVLFARLRPREDS